MNTRIVYFGAAIALFVVLLLCVATYFLLQRVRLRRRWKKMISELRRIDRDSIARVALDLVDEFGRLKSDEQAGSMEPSEMWQLLGGLEGVAALERNSDLLIDVAFYLQKCYPEAVTIAERLRRDARQLKWHVARLHGAAANGNLQVSFPFYAQRAAVSYYLIIRRVFLLCESGDYSMLSALEKAL
jgi:hypothetical protein